jgi:hypothetical protein
VSRKQKSEYEWYIIILNYSWQLENGKYEKSIDVSQHFGGGTNWSINYKVPIVYNDWLSYNPVYGYILEPSCGEWCFIIESEICETVVFEVKRWAVKYVIYRKRKVATTHIHIWFIIYCLNILYTILCTYGTHFTIFYTHI